MKKALIDSLLYGAGGHARVVISILNALGRTALAIFDDDPAKQALGRIPIVGSYWPNFQPNLPVIIAIGSNMIRQTLATQIKHPIDTLIHPSAVVDPTVKIGEGTVIVQRVVVQTDTQLGRHVIINTGASVDHDGVLGDFVQVAPGAILCGDVQVGEGTLIAAGAVVVPGIRIGRWAMVGAGAVVTRDVPDGAVVWGNPARIIRYQQL